MSHRAVGAAVLDVEGLRGGVDLVGPPVLAVVTDVEVCGVDDGQAFVADDANELRVLDGHSLTCSNSRWWQTLQ